MRPADARSKSCIRSREALSGHLGPRHPAREEAEPIASIGEAEPQLRALRKRFYTPSAAVLRISAGLGGIPSGRTWWTALARLPSHPGASPRPAKIGARPGRSLMARMSRQSRVGVREFVEVPRKVAPLANRTYPMGVPGTEDNCPRLCRAGTDIQSTRQFCKRLNLTTLPVVGWLRRCVNAISFGIIALRGTA